MAPEQRPRPEGDGSYDIDDVLKKLDELEDSVSSSEERHDVRQARRVAERVPGSKRISKYTTRDVSEGAVGAIVFSLPLLVEDGVFDIATWFVETTVGPVPVYLAIHVAFVCAMTAGLLYATDFRDIVATPIFRIVPRRLVAVLLVSFVVASAMMALWGRLQAGDPTALEAVARITVVWAAATLGATIADILPGESAGTDIRDRIADIGDGDGQPGRR